MKILALSDLHLGKLDSYLAEPREDEERLLDQVVELARTRQVDLVLLGGDLFNRPRPTPAVLHVFRRFTQGLADAQIPAIAVHGNLSHDLASTDEPSALELFESGWLSVCRHPRMLLVSDDLAVCALPSVPVHRLVAASDGGDRAEIYRQAAEALVGIAAGLRAQVPSGVPCVLLSHFAVSGSSLPSGLPVAELNEPVLDLGALEELNFDAVVLGHIHNPGVFGDVVLYTGSPMCLSFGEEHVGHGVWILDLEETAYRTTEFVDLDHRRFVTIDVDLMSEASIAAMAQGLDETDLIAAAISEALL